MIWSLVLFNSSDMLSSGRRYRGSIRVFCDYLPEEVDGLRGWQWGLGCVLFCNLTSEFFSLFIMSACSSSSGFNIKLVGYRSKSYSCPLAGVLRHLRLEFRDISRIVCNLLLLLHRGFSFSWCIIFQLKSVLKWPNKIYSTQENKIT